MTKDDFIFSIGYQGDTAIVDKTSKSKYKGLNTSELLKNGLYRAAFCSALYSEKQDDLNSILNAYNENSDKKYKSTDELKKLFGVYRIPEGIKKVSLI